MKAPLKNRVLGVRPDQLSSEMSVIVPGLTRRHELIIILVLATAVRFVDFTAPYTSQHWIKQLQIAPIAKNFATKNFNILWPETDYSADKPGYIEIEFQLVTWLSAVLYKMFGIHEWVGRLVTISFSVGSMVLLYRLMLMYLSPAAATYGLFFFAFVPTNWYFSRVLMSEPLMIFFSIALVYSFSLYLRTQTRRHFALTAVCGALCFLVKLPSALLVLPLACLAYTQLGSRMWRRADLWALAAIVFLPAMAYYAHAFTNIGKHYFTVGVGFKGGMWFALSDFMKPSNYSLMAMRFVRQHLTAIGVVLLPLGLLAVDDEQPRPKLFHFWLGAVVLYLVIVSGGNLRQNYYQLHFIPPAAALVGLGWERLVGSKRFSPLLSPVLAVMFLGLCGWGVQPMFERYEPIHTAAKDLRLLDPERKPVIIFPAGYGCLYYFDRPGWVGRESFGKPRDSVPVEDIPGPEYIDDRIKRGAGWAVYFDAKDHTVQPQIQQYLREQFRCASDMDDYQIFDLSQTADGRRYVPGANGTDTKASEAFVVPWYD